MSSTDTLALKDPEQLYLDWERAHWASQDVDLSRDPADWEGLEEDERGLLYFALNSLMVAEERISTQFCGLVLAQDDVLALAPDLLRATRAISAEYGWEERPDDEGET